MRETIPAPCAHYNIARGTYYATCPDITAKSEGEGCQYYMDSLTTMDIDSDPHGPCKRRNTQYADDKTIDMFTSDKEDLG